MGGDGRGEARTRSGIHGSAEWTILEGLHRQSSHLLDIKHEISKCVNRKSKRKRKQQLQDMNDWRQLNIQMREALSRPDYSILMDLDREANETSSANVAKAKTILESFCHCLEPLVNTKMIESCLLQSAAYPKLTTLIACLESPNGPEQPFELVSKDASTSALFIIEPGDGVRRTEKCMAKFNSFIQRLQLSGASLGELTRLFSPEPAPAKPPSQNYQGFGQRFCQQATCALRVIFSSISNCKSEHKRSHSVLLQLPSWQDVVSAEEPSISHALRLFLNDCSTSLWQETQVLTTATLTPLQRFKLGYTTQLFGFLYRKSLAIKFVMGLLLSLESGLAIKTWDSLWIRFLSKDGIGELRDLLYVLYEVADEVDLADLKLSLYPKVQCDSRRRVWIAVIDTGIDMNSVLIQGICADERRLIRPEYCRSWIGGENDFYDDVGYGTSCAYLAYMAAPDADIYVAKVFSDNLRQAIIWALDVWKVDIILMSFGLRPPTNPNQKDKWLNVHRDINNVINNAGYRIIFAAVSNGGLNEPCFFSAICRNVICVYASDGKGNDGGINPKGEMDENFMTLGVAVELIAYGEFVYKSGTSYATPIAAGIAASFLHIAQNLTMLFEEAKQDIRRCDVM
ncbi:peptidase S8/S53 domain-containing protein [Ilyonectria sp. MPI-CAGE-AT-0026]|nr:peptidase S8/S53 domain-containing protein [Ilyonectria sp. MPI-CAGE-AT-0026]